MGFLNWYHVKKSIGIKSYEKRYNTHTREVRDVHKQVNNLRRRKEEVIALPLTLVSHGTEAELGISGSSYKTARVNNFNKLHIIASDST